MVTSPWLLAPGLRKLALTAHVSSSIGWFGAVAAFLALAIAGLTTDPETARGVYVAMAITTWYVLVPASAATLLTGVVSSVGTPWGLLRHYWVLAKLVLTAIAAVVLWIKTPLIDRLAAATDLGAAALSEPRMEVIVHAAGGLVFLLVATVLGIYKPRGLTPYGRRRDPSATASEDTALPLWVKRSALAVVVLAILAAVVMHLAGGHGRHVFSHG